jgi:UDP-N-acetylglucosamine 2-epimerase (non-hydrolysing)
MDEVALPGLRITAPVGYIEFLRLMANAKIVLTDSGGVQEKTAILDRPAWRCGRTRSAR